MNLARSVIEWLIFGEDGERRYTQDSPVLPDVWIAYGMEPGRPQQLLITPERDARPGAVAVALRERLGLGEDGSGERGHGIAYTESSVAVRLDLGELVRAVLPMTRWWRRLVSARRAEDEGLRTEEEGRAPWLQKALREGTLERRLEESLRRIQEADGAVRGSRYDPEAAQKRATAKDRDLPLEMVWLARIVGWLAWAEGRQEEPAPPKEIDGFRAWRKKSGPRASDLVRALANLLAGPESEEEEMPLEEALPAPFDDPEARIWLVNRNRSAQLAVRDSRLAVKADAAWNLFQISCKGLAWAIIDSGIDATHLAFRKTDPSKNEPYEKPFEGGDGGVVNRTRISRTFDFSRVRLLLNPALLTALLTDAGQAGTEDELPAVVEQAIAGLVGGVGGWRSRDEHTRQIELLREHARDLRDLVTGAGELSDRLRDQLDDLRKRLRNGRNVDWALLEPFLEVRPEQYWIPASDHGTHVAGILAGSWEQDGKLVTGICPDLELYDFRVLPTGRSGPEDELNVIAALQFLRHLNRQKDHFVIHGVNLSLAIPHEVANYACGRTPVCDEVSRAISSGVVAVAAAGNNGYVRYHTAQGEREGYHTVSITDPGNAESVITVGATHRNRPHTYGVSYFSSRGPTGDGRSKPDLVAPGEKIAAPVFDGRIGEKDGTSMAAPHASGAAAMVMARHRELVGQPGRIKEILCTSATDLGRERYFQGSGMLDVLRALQSV